MVLAGFLSFSGKMNLFLAILVGTLGTLSGAILNYYLDLRFGRLSLKSMEDIFLLKKKTMAWVNELFANYGGMVTLVGRLIPRVKQYISFPPGFAKMSFKKFPFFTFLEAFLWISILASLGYFISQNQAVIKVYLNQITVFFLIISLFILLAYVFIKKRK